MMLEIDFNSNMVRLKGTLTYNDDHLPSVFQFQYGSIKRLNLYRQL